MGQIVCVKGTALTALFGGMERHPILIKPINYEWEVWFFPCCASTISRHRHLVHQIQICFTQRPLLPITYYVVFFLCKVHSFLYCSLFKIQASLYECNVWLNIGKQLASFFCLFSHSCLYNAVPQMPVHHTRPWVLICLCSSSSQWWGAGAMQISKFKCLSNPNNYISTVLPAKVHFNNNLSCIIASFTQTIHLFFF